jgi:hypothetical protein
MLNYDETASFTTSTATSIEMSLKVAGELDPTLVLNILIGFGGWHTISSRETIGMGCSRADGPRPAGTTLGQVVDAGTGAPGFALTGKESFLDPYVPPMRAPVAYGPSRLAIPTGGR